MLLNSKTKKETQKIDILEMRPVRGTRIKASFAVNCAEQKYRVGCIPPYENQRKLHSANL